MYRTNFAEDWCEGLKKPLYFQQLSWVRIRHSVFKTANNLIEQRLASYCLLFLSITHLDSEKGLHNVAGDSITCPPNGVNRMLSEVTIK